jgi:hypothetical protein
MLVLSTTYFDRGRVVRYRVQEPDKPLYECHYMAGELDVQRSLSVDRCPKVSELERR